jgi:hypothetical protein
VASMPRQEGTTDDSRCFIATRPRRCLGACDEALEREEALKSGVTTARSRVATVTTPMTSAHHPYPRRHRSPVGEAATSPRHLPHGQSSRE